MIRSIGVIGAGQMGNGIAHVFAQNGFAVILCDTSETQLANAMATIRENLGRQARKGVVDAGMIEVIAARIKTTRQLSELAAANFVVEAVTENESLKFEIFRQLDETMAGDVILASNTSSIPITRIAAATGRPEKVIGMHFMNPAPMMRLVEVIRGRATSDKTFAAVATLVADLGKEMAVSLDCPGFIVNRILIPMINEAIFALSEGIATAEDIDKGMTLGAGQPMGPLALADLIGLDTVLAIANVLYEGFKDPKYRPCPLLVSMVASGHLGRKSGRGFHTY
jgi:3-hydroxybutyryl-CoA dehydrogenase